MVRIYIWIYPKDESFNYPNFDVNNYDQDSDSEFDYDEAYLLDIAKTDEEDFEEIQILDLD